MSHTSAESGVGIQINLTLVISGGTEGQQENLVVREASAWPTSPRGW